MRKLYQFNGGVHPPQHKTESTLSPIAIAPIPEMLLVPFHQHIGNTAKPIVKVGERVLKGQKIGQAEGSVSCSIHAPTSGKIMAIDMQKVPHPSGLSDLCVTLEPDGYDEWIKLYPIHHDKMAHEDVREALREAGVVGLGGAVFPSSIKLNPGKNNKITTLVINGAECEPYITCDDMLMREKAAEIIAGAKIMRKLLGADEIVVGIEDNKPFAIIAMDNAARMSGEIIEVVPVPTVYPGGGAKQLIKVLTGIEVPAGERSIDLGVQCFNVATAVSVYRALVLGEPVISRIVTITGNVEKAGNVEALLGTPIDHLLALAKPHPDSNGLIMGGPMMGFDLPSSTVPVVKATNCVIVKSEALFPPAPMALPCIRCGRCAEACPANLQPQELYWFSRAKNFGKAQEYSLFDCIECGCCSYVCPSHIPLVQFYRFAKSEIWASEKEKKASDLARSRHDFRQARLERDKKEKAEKLALKTTQAQQEPEKENTE